MAVVQGTHTIRWILFIAPLTITPYYTARSQSFDPTKPRGGRLESNTDVCYVDLDEAPTSSRVRSGLAIFPEDIQVGREVNRCHGFTWAEDPMAVSNLFKGNALFKASL